MLVSFWEPERPKSDPGAPRGAPRAPKSGQERPKSLWGSIFGGLGEHFGAFGFHFGVHFGAIWSMPVVFSSRKEHETSSIFFMVMVIEEKTNTAFRFHLP